MDEVAYEAFKVYLQLIKDALLDQEGGAEIVADIEARIAELFTEKLTARGTEVVTQEDVDSVIETLGHPEDFAQEEEYEQPQERKTTSREKAPRRLFRNAEEQIVGGVASGIAAYFNIDPIWIRLAFVLTTIFGGVGFPAYLILWIAIPEAKTTAQKLQMRGEPINLNNIEKSVKEELNGVKERLGKFRSREGNGSSISNAASRFFNFLLNIVEAFFAFLIKVLSYVGIVAGSIIALLLILALVGIGQSSFDLGPIVFINGNTFFGGDYAEVIFGQGWGLNLLRLGIGLTLFLPIVSLILLVMRAFGQRLAAGKAMTLVSTLLFFIGLGLIISSGVGVARDFQVSATEQKRIPLSGTTFDMRADFLEEHRGFLFNVDDEYIRIEDFDLNIKRTRKPEAYLELKHRVQGSNAASARVRAQLFEYPIDQQGEVLRFNEYFLVPKEALYRGQELRANLYLPDGAEIFLDPSVENIIQGVSNVHNMWDHDMIGHTWVMKSDGLHCMDCEDVDLYDAEDLEESEWGEEFEEREERTIEALERKIEALEERLEERFEEQ